MTRHRHQTRLRGTTHPSPKQILAPTVVWRAIGVARGQGVAARDGPHGPDIDARTRGQGTYRSGA